MENLAGQFVFTYLLMPIIAVIVGCIMVYVAKKNKLLTNKKAIFYFLLLWGVLAFPALLGFIDYWFMPYAYLGLMLLYFLLGILNINVFRKAIPEVEDMPFYVEFLFLFLSMFIGMGLFTLIFNLCNELQYGIWAATTLMPFIFPCVFRRAFISFLNIPLEVYKVWNYHNQGEELNPDLINYSKVLVVEVEIFKKSTDQKAQNIKAKSSEDLAFGAWFKIFIDDYNKRTPQSQIAYFDSENTYGWIFYTTSSILGHKKHIDPELTFAQNKIKEKNVIIAKRTKYHEFE